jgi:hypothetical protein
VLWVTHRPEELALFPAERSIVAGAGWRSHLHDRLA